MDHPGLYIHIPFCRSKCGYCDFYSIDTREAEGAFVKALVTEMKNRVKGQPISTVFMGGGTPTVLNPAGLEEIVSIVMDLSGKTVTEFSCEANPESVTPDKAKILSQGGVNRLSIGVQSMDESELSILGRVHSVEDVTKAVQSARNAGFENLGLDLIFGIPGQTLAGWKQSLKKTIDLLPEHVSTYGLTWEEGTPFEEQRNRGKLIGIDEDLEASLYGITIDTLTGRGYEQYEISNFALPDRECRHNLNYWRNGTFIGVGPSAVGYIDGVRYRNTPDVNAYIQCMNAGESCIVEEEHLTGTAHMGECLMLGLRRCTGVDLAEIAGDSDMDLRVLLEPELDRFSTTGLLEIEGNQVRLSRAGLLVADSIIADLMGGLDRAVDGLHREC